MPRAVSLLKAFSVLLVLQALLVRLVRRVRKASRGNPFRFLMILGRAPSLFGLIKASRGGVV
jgi:hypothetical protein